MVGESPKTELRSKVFTYSGIKKRKKARKGMRALL